MGGGIIGAKEGKQGIIGPADFGEQWICGGFIVGGGRAGEGDVKVFGSGTRIRLGRGGN